MLAKLSIRNMKRSSRDYLVYVVTMTIVTALMYAFNSLIFEDTLQRQFEVAPVMPVMLGLATFFIVLIVAWLINYMVRFMLEMRSAEFGIYLLLGMKKKQLSRLYMRENVLLGGVSFLFGLLSGALLRQILLAILFAMIHMSFGISFSYNLPTLLMTILCYGGCYLLALLRCGRKFRKMNIRDLMDARRKNEEIRERHESGKRILLPVSVLFLLLFWTLFGKLSDALQILLFLIGLVLTIYLFYVGISAWIICYIRKKGALVYRGQNLFLLRQFASKVRTMQFTMGTLTALFTLALMGSSIALMFSDFENTVLEDKFPFDVLIYSPDAADSFSDDLDILRSNVQIKDLHLYRIYTSQENQVNTWMLTHLRDWGREYVLADGSPDTEKISRELEDGGAYCAYDTYMGLSDYNYLRRMLGYETVSLNDDSYLIQIKARLKDQVMEIGKDLRISDPEGTGLLNLAGIYSEPFCQDGHNGGDYLIIVPDKVLDALKPYYSELAASLREEAPPDLMQRLDSLSEKENPFGHVNMTSKGNSCCGSDNMVVYASVNLVRTNVIPEVKYVLASIIFPMFYIGLVFVCVAVTVLSVQQLSDSAKYRFRYDVLKKLGLNRVQRSGLIFRQLAAYYLCPAVLAIIISGKMILYASYYFVLSTGVTTPAGGFFARSILLFFGIYLVYFAVTYIGFQRNVGE